MTGMPITTAARLLAEWVFTVFAASYFVVWGLVLSLVCLCVRPFLSQRQAHRIARFSMHYLLRSYFAALGLSGLFKVDCSALESLRNERGMIIIANHPCLMDALFVNSRLPNAVSVMKSSVLHNPILFGGAWLGGYIRTDSLARFVAQCERTLGDGGQLLFFPEGTRSMVEPVNTFKEGFALIAQKTGAPIQTVFVNANTSFLSKDWPILKKPPFPLKYRVTLGDRFYMEKGQSPKAFTTRMETYFRGHLINEHNSVREQHTRIQSVLRADQT